MRARAIREALSAIDKDAVEALQALCTKHGIAEAPSTEVIQRPPVTAGPTVTAPAIPPPAHTPIQFDWIAAYRQLRDPTCPFSDTGSNLARRDYYMATNRIRESVIRRFRRFVGNLEHLLLPSSGAIRTEQAYRAIQDTARRAAESDNATRAYEIRQALEDINKLTIKELDELTRKYGGLDALSTEATRTTPATQAMQRPPATAGSSVTVASTTVARPVRLELLVPAHPIALAVNPAFPEPAGGLVHVTDVPGPPPASGLPGPSLSGAAGAKAGDPGHGRLDPPATVSGATAAQPAATEATVTPSLSGTSSFWLQPVDPAPTLAPPPPPSAPGRAGAGAVASPPAADPWGHSTAGEGRRAAAGRRRPLVRAPVPAARSWTPGRNALRCCRPAHRRGGRAPRRPASSGRPRAPSSSRSRTARRWPGSTQSSRFGPAAPGRSAGPPRSGERCSTTSTGSTPSSSRPPRPWPTSTGARLRR